MVYSHPQTVKSGQQECEYNLLVSPAPKTNISLRKRSAKHWLVAAQNKHMDVIHACCHFVIRDNECPDSSRKGPSRTP